MESKMIKYCILFVTIIACWFGYSPPQEEPQIEPTIVKVEQPKAFTPHDKVPMSKELQEFAYNKANEHNVPYHIVLAVIEQESSFDIEADSGDSVGLMQINLVHGDRDIIINPYENIKIGVWLLGYLHREYDGNWDMALTAYNCGEQGAYEQYFKHGEMSSSYSDEVLQRSEKFSNLLGGV